MDLTSVKREEIERLETIRDIERFLRDSSTFDQLTAKRVVIKLRELIVSEGGVQSNAGQDRFDKLTAGIATIFSRSKPGTRLH